MWVQSKGLPMIVRAGIAFLATDLGVNGSSSPLLDKYTMGRVAWLAVTYTL